MSKQINNKNEKAMDFTHCWQPFWEDTRAVRFDDTCVFGHGTCFDGWEYLREETDSPIGRFAVWKEMGVKDVWSAYGGNLGYLAWHQFKNESEAKQWVVDCVNGLCCKSDSELLCDCAMPDPIDPFSSVDKDTCRKCNNLIA